MTVKKHGQREATIDYGREVIVEALDDSGSTVSTETRVHEHMVNSNPLKRYEVRVRVTSDKDLVTEFLRFTDYLSKLESLYTDPDSDKHNPAFKIEKNKKTTDQGYYYIWKCWTERLSH